jgi:mannosyltransferase OCH1-like enzyme
MVLSNGEYHWITGYFVVVQKWQSGQWWYAVARPLIKAIINAGTETTTPVYYPESAIRRAKIQERHPQTLSHYKGKSYWQQLGHYYRRIDLPNINI